MVSVHFRGADHEYPVHLHHAGGLWADDRGVSDSFRWADPPSYHDQPGMGQHRAELPEIPVCSGFSGISYHGVRGHLFRAGAEYWRWWKCDNRHLGLHGLYGVAVLCTVQNGKSVKISVWSALNSKATFLKVAQLVEIFSCYFLPDLLLVGSFKT